MNRFRNIFQACCQTIILKWPYPNCKKFFAPIVITINLMYLSMFISSSYNSELQNGIVFFGCAIGSKLYKYLLKFQSRCIFILTDIVVLIILIANVLIIKEQDYQIITQAQNQQNINYEILTALKLCLKFIIGVMGGVNLLQVILYLKFTNTEYDLQLFSLFIPLSLTIGSAIEGGIVNNLIDGFFLYFPGLMTVLRLMLIPVLKYEALCQNIQQMEQAQQNSQATALVEDVVQAQQQIQNDKFLISFLRNFKYMIIAVIFQTSSMPFHLHFLQIFYVIWHMLFFYLIDKRKTIIFGQICICFGYCFNLIFISIFGYYFGLGTLFYQMLCKISTEDLIAISEIMWIIRLSTMCFIAVMQSISQQQFLLGTGVSNNVFFILNFINLIFLYVVLFSNKNEKNKVEIEQQLKEEIKQDENDLIIEQ